MGSMVVIDPIPITWKWNDPWVVGKSSILSRDIIDHSSNTGTPVLMFMDIPMISNYISNGHRFIDQRSVNGKFIDN